MKISPLAVLSCTLFVLTFQVTVTDEANLPSMGYYAELLLDGNVADSVSSNIQSNTPITLTGDANNATINNVSITTDCRITGQEAECRCQQSYVWSGSVCTSHPQCCLNETVCKMVISNNTSMCLPKKRVTVRGTLTITDTFTEDLNDIKSVAYTNLAKKIKDQLKIHFSDLNEFDCVKIIRFSKGSIIVEFVMLTNAPFNNKMFEQKVKNASNSLNGSITASTTGIVQMTIKDGNEKIVKSGIQVEITCTLEDNTVKPKWFLSQKGVLQEILSGNEVDVGSVGPVYSIKIFKTSENWGGIYTCEFSQGSITHKGFKTLDVALLPDYIVGVANPQFPDCRENGVIQVNSTCSIRKSNETYTVKWTNTISNLKVTEKVSTSSTTVNCAAVAGDITVTCSFENIMQQVKSQVITISIIKGDENACPKEGDWPLTKSGKVAVLQCADTEVGTRTRKCGESKWEESLEDCIDRELYEVRQRAEKLAAGIGNPKEVVNNLLNGLAAGTDKKDKVSVAGLNASLTVLKLISTASMNTNTTFSGDVLTNYVGNANSLMEPSLADKWKGSTDETCLKASDFLQSIENFTKLTYANNGSFYKNFTNIELKGTPILADNEAEINSSGASVKMNFKKTSPNVTISILTYFSLNSILPQNTMEGFGVNSKIQSITIVDAKPQGVEITFQLQNETSSKYKMMCVYWDFKANDGNGGWSSEGCKWDRQDSNSTTSSCVCDHLTSFSVLMSKFPISLPWLDEIGYVGVGVSICSLMLCLIIEFLVWNSVVKSNISHFRHTALVNISVSLLIADCCFLSASFQGGKGGKLCLALAMAMHVSFLAMFFWMLCQSIMLLHQMIFLFQQLRKKMYLSFSFALGYLGPICIVIGTYMVNPDKYHNKDSCWLTYEGGMKGSIFAFVLPVGIIVIINTFTLVVVISKLLRPSVSEGDKADDKEAVKSIMKAVIILTPVFGLTWALGFLTLIFDLPETFGAMAVHYLFSILNSFQGLLILITGCFTEKKVREALLKRYAPQSKSETSNSVKK